MIDNKYLRNIYGRLAQIFEDKPPQHVDTEEEKEEKTKDKSQILNREARSLTALIACNIKLADCIGGILKKSDDGGIESLKLRKEMLQIRKDNVKLELEYYGKMDFIGQYDNIVKLSRETAAAELKQANENIDKVAMELQEMLPRITDGTPEKALTIGILHEHFLGSKKLTSRQFTEFYKRLVDITLRNKQFLKVKEFEGDRITV